MKCWVEGTAGQWRAWMERIGYQITWSERLAWVQPEPVMELRAEASTVLVEQRLVYTFRISSPIGDHWEATSPQGMYEALAFAVVAWGKDNPLDCGRLYLLSRGVEYIGRNGE